MTENPPHSNIRERIFEISPSEVKVSANTRIQYGILTRDINIGDTEIWVQDTRFTPEQFMQRFDFYVNLHDSGHTSFYPYAKVLKQSGISQLLLEIKEFGITDYQDEIYNLLFAEVNIAKNGDNPLTLDALRKEIKTIFDKKMYKKIWQKPTWISEL